jgi:PAT family beta-lactamase induction signal transducer AmpG
MLTSAIRVYRDPVMLAILLLGFSSGLPLALTASTLSAWLTEAQVSKSAIGLFASVATPYALKFLWSPLIDAAAFPVLCRRFGRRRGWLLATQLCLMMSITLLGMADPAINPWLTAFCALLVAIGSASQDIVIDAYRVEILKPEQYGAGAAAAVLGYRFGMIASSALPLYIYAAVGWQATYALMAALMGVGLLTTLASREPEAADGGQKTVDRGRWLREHVIAPFADFMQRPHWLAILLFILLYKLGDAFMGVMTNPFLLGIGFTGPQIATVLKLYGVIATIAGSVLGGALAFRIGITRSLWICGIVHMLTNLMFVVQARLGADVHFLTLSITLENVSGGMGTAAFVAFMSSLTHVRFTATQYALLSSFAAFGRTWLSAPSGWVSQQLGWEGFFTFASLLALPGLFTLWWLSRRLDLDHQGQQGK